MREFYFSSEEPNRDKTLFFTQFRDFAAEQKWSLEIRNEVELILEEWLTNVFNYAFTNTTNKPQLKIHLQADGNQLHIQVDDNGLPFDPTARKDPDTTIPIEDKPVGGLGIFMIKKLSNRIDYVRSADWNRLVIQKDLTKPVLGSKS